MIRKALENAENVDEAITLALEMHDFPLAFSDIESLMPERFKHREKIRRSIKRLLRQNIIQEIWVVTPEGAVKAYSIRTDTSYLIAIPVKDLKEHGYYTYLGLGYEKDRPGYPLYRLDCDILFIHVDKKPLKAPIITLIGPDDMNPEA